jgi:hypothetical protein
VARTGQRMGLAHHLDLRVAPHEERERPRGEGLEGSPRGPGTHQLKDLQRLSQPPDGRWTERFDLDHLLGESEGLRRQEDAPRHRQLFHAGRQMRRLPDSRVIHMQIVADRTNHHFTRIQTYPDLDLDTMCLADVVGVCPKGFLHSQGGIAGPDGMIFMANRRPKERHDTVPHDLIDRPLIPMHRRHHPFQHRIEQLPSLFRIAVGQEFHGASQISKEHSDVLALTFEGAAGGEDFLSEIGRCVGDW